MDLEEQKKNCNEEALCLFKFFFEDGDISEDDLPRFSEKCQDLMRSYPEYASLRAAVGNYSLNKKNMNMPLTIKNPTIGKIRSFFSSEKDFTFRNFGDLEEAYLVSLRQKVDKDLSKTISIYAFYMIFLDELNISGFEMKAMSDISAYLAFNFRKGLINDFTKN
ncbi:hypothetical protein [Pseudidiomarina sp.]|uniref:hypothetical protein n=1 Tax=Pseudidiomarina sp. TaxID=2081707 RepID=UPI003A977ABD